VSHGGRPTDETRSWYQRTDPPTEEQGTILVACRDQGGLVLRAWEYGTREAWTTGVCARVTTKSTRPEIRYREVVVRGMVRRDWLRQDGDQIEITELGERAIARAKQTEAA
jgi:hypothetical protein